MAELPTLDEEIAQRLRAQEACISVSAPQGQFFEWSMEMTLLRGGDLSIRQQLMEAFGMAAFYQAKNGEIFVIPVNSDIDCLKLQPAGVG